MLFIHREDENEESESNESDNSNEENMLICQIQNGKAIVACDVSVKLYSMAGY